MRLLPRSLLAACALILAAGPAAAAPSEQAIGLARRYFAAAHVDDAVRARLRTVTPGLVEQMVRKNPQLNAQQRAQLKEAAAEAEVATARKMVDRLAPAFAQSFTEAELQQIVAFYESPAGKALTAKTPALAAQMGPTFKALAPEMLADLNTRFCAKAGCRLKPAAATSRPSSPARP